MSRTLDANLLVYAADRTAERHERARAFLDHVATTRLITYLFWPVLLGYVRIVTHSGILSSPLSPAAAVADVEDLISRPQIVVVGERERFWNTFKDVAARTAPRGRLVPDAHLVALMLEHGVATMWSGDRDFRKFDGVTVKDPFDERYSAGFE
jgi:toxin-antitoxin system PIN domain toxin